MDDVMIAYPKTRPMCSADCDGAAAAVPVSEATLLRALADPARWAVVQQVPAGVLPRTAVDAALVRTR